MQTALLVINLLFGLLACFFGYRILRVWLALVGWQTGTSIVLVLLSQRMANETLLLVLSLLAGLAAAILFYALFKPAVFIVGAIVFAAAAQVFTLAVPGLSNIWITLIIGLAGGLISVFMVRPILILTSALGGALAVVDSTAALISDHVPAALLDPVISDGSLPRILFIIGVAVLTILGMVVQFRQSNKKAAAASESKAGTHAAAGSAAATTITPNPPVSAGVSDAQKPPSA